MKFNPIKFKITLDYIVNECEPGGTIRSKDIEGLTEAEMYEYARIAYDAHLIRDFIDFQSLSSIGCEMGNLTYEGYALYKDLNNSKIWNQVKKLPACEIMCIYQLIEAVHRISEGLGLLP